MTLYRSGAAGHSRLTTAIFGLDIRFVVTSLTNFNAAAQVITERTVLALSLGFGTTGLAWLAFVAALRS